MKKLLPLLKYSVLRAAGTNLAAQSSNDFPPNARPGKCYCQCLIPDQYENITYQILLKEAAFRFEVVPAVYDTVTEQILIKPAYKVFEVKPATFTTTTENIITKEASSNLVYVAPVFETVAEQILVSPAGNKWVSVPSNRNCATEAPCRTWCLTPIPPQFKKVAKQRLKVPAFLREISIPAESRTITKAVVQQPAIVAEREVAAEYRTVTKLVLRSPATTHKVEIPAEYTTVTTKHLVKPGYATQWVEVMCGSHPNSNNIKATQKALNARGYKVPVDNVLGPSTRKAIIEFQKTHKLPVGNLNLETLRALGVE